MTVLLLCGGRGIIDPASRLRVPKAMLSVGDVPLIRHIMRSFACYGHTKFVLALGDGQQHIRRHFLEYGLHSRDIEIELANGEVQPLTGLTDDDWSVKLVDTGIEAQTGSRIARCQRFLAHDTFFVAYADCLCDANLGELISFHRARRKILTITGVRPPTRFGTFYVENDEVVGYAPAERLAGHGGYINGGFMVCEPRLFDYLEPYTECNLEKEVFERLAISGEVSVYPHSGYWQAVDTERDLLLLNERYSNNERPWLPRSKDFA